MMEGTPKVPVDLALSKPLEALKSNGKAHYVSLKPL